MKTGFDKSLRIHMMLSYYNYGLTQHFCTQLKALLKQTLTVANSTSIRRSIKGSFFTTIPATASSRIMLFFSKEAYFYSNSI